MLSNQKLKNRELYLNKLIAFKDNESVKVITGIRRCGKSSLLKLMAEYLKESGVRDEQILEINFESYNFKDMSADALYHYVLKNSVKDARMYLFFDEIQRIDAWEDTINAFRVDIDCDIYLTGSNAYLLSSEYSTYLSGRYVEIKMLPLSFSEFLSFHGFEVKEINSLGVTKKAVYSESGVRYELTELFDAYLRFGGMPGIADVGFDTEKALTLLDGIYSTVVMRDILERNNRRGKRQFSDPLLLKKITMFLADNIGNNISVSSIGNVLTNEGLLEERNSKSSPSVHTVSNYVSALLESYFFYDIKRFDIKGKEYLRTLGKYYIVDIGLRNYLLGFRNRDVGHILENIVYLELLSRGYDVAIGKVGNNEIDFIATNAYGRTYIQVTESMREESVQQRELKPLKQINDNYEKIILTTDVGLESCYNGIKVLDLTSWLLEK